MDYKQFSQLNLGTMPTDELFNLYKQAKTSSYKQPKLPMWDDPQMPVPQQETRYAPVEYTPEQAVSRANQQYANDRHGMQQLGKIGAETASMLPTAVAGGLAGGSAMVGAKAGGATWDESLGSYNEASDAAKQVVHNVLGNPSELMEAFDTYGFAPVNEYITKQSGDPRLGERLMDLLVMRGGLHGKQGKVAEFGQKAADTGLVTGAAAISPQLQDMSDDELGKLALAVGAIGTVAATESRSPIKQQIFELQKAIRETADPVMKADLGRQIKELQQSKPTQNLPVPVERPLIDPEGPTFQLKSLNAINQLKPEMKLNGPQLYKHLKRNGVSDVEISDVLGDIKTVGPITTAARWAGQVEQNAPKIGIDIYGGSKTKAIEPQQLSDLNRVANEYYQADYGELDSNEQRIVRDFAGWDVPNVNDWKPAPYQTYFRDEAAKYGSDMDTYQVARVNAELPDKFVEDNRSISELEATKDALIELEFEYRRDNGLNREQSFATEQGRYYRDTINEIIRQINYKERGYDIDKPTWKETEHGEIRTENPLGGFITSEAKLPTGEAVTVMYEGQPPNIVKEQSRSVEQTAKKMAAKDNLDWSTLSDLDKRSYLRDAESQKASNPVPEPLAERAMELAAKQMIAQAKEAGHAGILLSTGEDVIKRWSGALRDVADEARYNPETQELKLYKNGSPSRAQSQLPAKVPPEKLKDYVGGQEAADRLLASEPNSAVGDWEPHQFIDNAWVDSSGISIVNESTNSGVRESGYDSRTPFRVDSYDANGDQITIGRFSTLDKAKQHAESIEHVLTDLSIDKRWPTIEYGQFEGGEIVKTPSVDKIDKATFDSVRSKFLKDFPEADGHIKRFLLDIADSKKEINNLSNSTVRWLDAYDLDLPTVYDWLSENYGVTSSTGGNYLPGKIAQTLKRLTGGEIEMVEVGGKPKLDYDQRYDEVVQQNPEIHKVIQDRELNKMFVDEPSYEGARKYFFEDNENFMDDAMEFTSTVHDHIANNPDGPVAIKLMGKDWAGKEGAKKPFLRFKEDTPKTFSIYEWAAITGLSVKMIEEYLNADDNKKQRMMKVMPVLGSIMTQRGNIRNTVGKTPSFIGREIAQPKALPSDAAVRAQEGIKNQILNSKLVPPGFPVRMTNVGELLDIANKSSLREGRAFEGNAGISAQVIPQGVKNPPIQSYGGNNLRSVAVIFPKDAVVNKGVNPNEVKINPSFDPNKARYLVSGYKRALTLTEVKSLIKKGLLTE